MHAIATSDNNITVYLLMPTKRQTNTRLVHLSDELVDVVLPVALVAALHVVPM